MATSISMNNIPHFISLKQRNFCRENISYPNATISFSYVFLYNLPKNKPSSRLAVFKKRGFQSNSQREDAENEVSNEENSLKFPFQFSSKSPEKSLNLVLKNSLLRSTRKQDDGTVFITGATGLLGCRISLKMLRQGFKIRAGVSDLSSAQRLAQFGSDYKIVSREDAKRLNAIEFEMENMESIAKAIGNASKAVVSIGPEEDGPGSKSTIENALLVIEAIKLANVKHIVVVYEPEAPSLNVLEGINMFLNGLFGNSGSSLEDLINKIVELELIYTVLKVNKIDDFSLERPGCNLVLKTEGNADPNDKVSRNQVASLVAEVFMNAGASENKVIEVAATTSAPFLPTSELLRDIPLDGRLEDFAKAQAQAREKEEARITVENGMKAEGLAEQLEAEAKRLAEKEAQASELAAELKASGANASFDYFRQKAREFGIDFFDGNFQKGRLSLLKPIKRESSTLEERKLLATTNEKTLEVPKPQPIKNMLGSIFKQETVYMEEE